MSDSKNLQRFKGTYAYGALGIYSRDQEGVWEIYGEDPNCDFGGHHHEPLLDVVSGKLEDVIAYAVELPNFWQWGSGGRIIKRSEKIKVIDSQSNMRIIALQRKVNELKELLAEAEQELEDAKS